MPMTMLAVLTMIASVPIQTVSPIWQVNITVTMKTTNPALQQIERSMRMHLLYSSIVAEFIFNIYVIKDKAILKHTNNSSYYLSCSKEKNFWRQNQECNGLLKPFHLTFPIHSLHVIPPVPLHLWQVLITAVFGTATSLTSSLNMQEGCSSISHGAGAVPLSLSLK